MTTLTQAAVCGARTSCSALTRVAVQTPSTTFDSLTVNVVVNVYGTSWRSHLPTRCCVGTFPKARHTAPSRVSGTPWPSSGSDTLHASGQPAKREANVSEFALVQSTRPSHRLWLPVRR